MNEVIKTILGRRSIRAFTDKKIEVADLDTILQAAVYAPSGRNTQDWQFTVVQDQKKLLQLNDQIRKALERASDYNCYYHAPVLVIASHDKDSKLAPCDCACALQNMFLAAASLGIGSCWINQLVPWQAGSDAAVKTMLHELGIPANHVVYGCAALGYAQNVPPAPPRREGTIVRA